MNPHTSINTEFMKVGFIVPCNRVQNLAIGNRVIDLSYSKFISYLTLVVNVSYICTF